MSIVPVLADLADREAIRGELNTTFVVEAAAGTGKTSELVKRIVRVVSSGRSPIDGIVAVTFTEKAAGELKLRLRTELEEARQDPAIEAGGRERLEAALKGLEEAHVSTIHGFCADLLRERPVEAGVDPLFTVLTEPQSRALYDEAFSGWFQEALENPPEGIRRSLRRSSPPTFGGDADADGPVERLKRAGRELVEWRDFEASWSRPVFFRESTVDALVDQVCAFAAQTERAASRSDTWYTATEGARRAAAELRLVMAAGDYDAAEGILVDMCRDWGLQRTKRSYGSTYGPGISRAEFQKAREALVAALNAFKEDADADLAALLRDELRGTIERYEALKAARGGLDFLDLLLRARTLVRDHEDVRREFQTRFRCIFVDEFQDTDPLQAEILLLLAANDECERDWRQVTPEAGKLFIVGDPKQSIYRFRRADVSIYQDVCEQLQARGARVAHLTTSFRSVPNLQRAINTAFAPQMTGDREALQAHYKPLAPHRPPVEGQPSLVALPVPRPYGAWKVTAGQVEKSLPDAIGAFVHWLVEESGWKVTERRSAGALVPIEARHVCILFRRLTSYGEDMSRAYVDALEARGIRHLLVGGRAFHDREEIETLRAALAAVEWPDDELSVFATLRGALFAIGDDELLEYRLGHAKAFHPFRVASPLPAHLEPIAEALAVLADLHVRRNSRPVAETITRLFEATRAHVGFALRRAGEQVLANALHVAELARQYELSGGISFRGFVEELRSAAEQGQASEAPILEEGSDGVRLMTVHKAKGLEFPVVILADLTAKLAPKDASRHLDPARGLCALRIGGWSPLDLLQQQSTEQERERAEGVRLAYVAATRARDLLVVPAIGDAPYDGGWLGPMDAGIYPPLDARRTQTAAAGCPPFKKDSVLQRPNDGIASTATVCPGLHRLGEGPDTLHEVVWWDPSALGLDAEPPFGLRRQELISKEVSDEQVAEGQRRYRDWRAARDAAIAAGGVPSLRVKTATEWAVGAPGAWEPAGAVEVVELDLDPGRPSGPRYGTLVHASLATVALDAGAEAIRQVVATQARIAGATEDEAASAVSVVARVLAHPMLEEARRAETSGRCLRETPLTFTIDGAVVEGVVDFAFEADGHFVVIDFKTDRAEGERLRQYERQAGLYAEAIARATGKPSRAVLMKV